MFRTFCEGTVNKTHRPFSKMSLDECHEQNNACVKEDEEQSALLRSRDVNEFLRGLEKTEVASQPSHHEDKAGKTIMCGLI